MAVSLSMAFDPTAFIFYLALFFLVFYLGGSFFNSRRLAKISAALISAIRGMGAKANYRRLGPSAAVLSGHDFLGAISEYSIAVALLPMANPITWLSSRAARRRDYAVLRARLKVQPPFDITLVNKRSPAYRYSRNPRIKSIDFGDFLLLRRDTAPSPEAFQELLKHLRPVRGVLMFILSKNVPHLQVYMTLKSSPQYYRENLEAIGKALAAIGLYGHR